MIKGLKGVLSRNKSHNKEKLAKSHDVNNNNNNKTRSSSIRLSFSKSQPEQIKSDDVTNRSAKVTNKILNDTPKDEIPLRTPRRQRSSRINLPTLQQHHLEKNLRFTEVPPSKRQELFILKLQQCQIIFDFNDSTSELRNKEIKRQELQEMLEYISTSKEAISDAIYPHFIQMFTVNAFRTISPPPLQMSNTFQENYDPESDDSALETTWPHLQLVYELFLRFLESPKFNPHIAKKFINEKFILQLLELFDSEDPRERDFLKTILHRIYGKILGLRAFIRRSINHIFFQFIYETFRFNGISELLEILGSIINGFALPLKEEHKTFLLKVLIPLHTSPSLASYGPQLTYCVVQFLEKEPQLASGVIRGLLRYWPKLNSSKEVLFLTELEEIIMTVNEDALLEVMIPFFTKLANCVDSCHFQVAERALYFYTYEDVIQVIHDYSKVIMPIIFPSLYQKTDHWNQAIYGLVYNALELLEKINSELFDQLVEKFHQEELENVKIKHIEDRTSVWKTLNQQIIHHKNVMINDNINSTVSIISSSHLHDSRKDKIQDTQDNSDSEDSWHNI
ncbi:phosphatase 2A regulatory B subunit-domain-containing protein [Cokeromyces recurvatus]|uniref:phosphatase 2A regulatory B subunit-domain-containing protein n=1 Tax=Cokeromyces recurvatus TaxID=90255 RepID=UPI00221FAA47|nr:phosphatase 2A regulatory B subunit-domain-containing protein [Cokeromyces recurvatus]KAI7906307.1 phosphatase 2A regulatory B subunit-domain-containing protein [Cokeromyces recurvatus]